MTDSKDIPKPKTQTDQGGSGKPPRKTAVGTGGGGGDDFYPGQSIVCKVLRKEPGGYAVLLVKYGTHGFLASKLAFKIGIELIAQFVCKDKGRVLLAQDVELGERNVSEYESTSSTENKKVRQRSKPKKKTQNIQYRRAYDIVMPPLEESFHKSISLRDYEADWLITDLEGGMRTACVKFDNSIDKTRGMLLLNKGRVVGCTYNSLSIIETKPTEESIDFVLRQMKNDNTVLSLYDLDTDIVVPMSALFLGYPVDRKDDYNSLEYFRYILDWFEKQKSTATVISTLGPDRNICLSFISKGLYRGSFAVNEQNFEKDRNSFEEVLNEYLVESTLAITILPPEFLSKREKYGFSLSVAMKNLDSEP